MSMRIRYSANLPVHPVSVGMERAQRHLLMLYPRMDVRYTSAIVPGTLVVVRVPRYDREPLVYVSPAG